MKKISILLKKCKNLSKTLGRSSSYTSLSSKSARLENMWCAKDGGGGNYEVIGCEGGGGEAIIFVGSSRRRYLIKEKHLSHPIIRALIDCSRQGSEDAVSVKCEVVLFDHLLWMLENDDLETISGNSLEELAALYAY